MYDIKTSKASLGELDKGLVGHFEIKTVFIFTDFTILKPRLLETCYSFLRQAFTISYFPSSNDLSAFPHYVLYFHLIFLEFYLLTDELSRIMDFNFHVFANYSLGMFSFMPLHIKPYTLHYACSVGSLSTTEAIGNGSLCFTLVGNVLNP